MAFPDIFLIALSTLSLTSFLLYEATPTTGKFDPETCQTSVCHQSAQEVLDSMDTSVDPCDDFYRYACGGWIDKHPIPEGKTSYSVFQLLRDEVTHAMIKKLKTANSADLPKPIRDAAILFQGCLDEGAREAKGTDPLKQLLNAFGGWPMINPEWSDAGYQWYTQVAEIMRTLDIGVILGIRVREDVFHSSRYIIFLKDAKFGIEKEHLKNLTASEKTREIVDAYKEYIMSSAKLLDPNIDEIELSNAADEIIQFESSLQQNVFMGNETDEDTTTDDPWYNELMDFVERQITKEPQTLAMSVAAVQKSTHNKYFKWTDFFNVLLQDFPEVTDSTEIILQDEVYVRDAVKIINETDPRIVANYIGWILVKNVGGHTTKEFRDTSFRFKKALDDTRKRGKLEIACVAEATNLLGYAVGRLYVDNYITDEAKHDVDALIEDIRSAYEINMNHNEWMDPETKSKALEKLRVMMNLVAYPPWIKNDTELIDYYSDVQDIKKDEYFASFLKVKAVATAKKLELWNQPLLRTRWFTFPSVVNAFYHPLTNTMTFPSAILNSPFYKYGRSPALNYGGFGFIIGHEISHGFDNSGKLRDKDGKLVDWWSKETGEKFRQKADCMENQYSSFVDPMTNMSINGAKTLGDNIADNGGVRNAFIAYKLKILQAQENEVIPNLKLPGISATPEQLFFLGLAMGICKHDTEESLEDTIETDVHAPSEYRVLVPFGNSKAFAEAFNCPVGSRMNPEAKCSLM